MIIKIIETVITVVMLIVLMCLCCYIGRKYGTFEKFILLFLEGIQNHLTANKRDSNESENQSND